MSGFSALGAACGDAAARATEADSQRQERMSDRREEFRVGVVALATVAIVVLLVALNTGTSFSLGGGSPYDLEIRVDRAPGVGRTRRSAKTAC